MSRRNEEGKGLNYGGVNGLGDRKLSPEEFLELRAIVQEASRNQTPEQKRKTTLLACKLNMLDYLEKDSPELKGAGEFLEDLLAELKIRKGVFAKYIGMQAPNLSAIFVGKRKISTDMAMKLAVIFEIEVDLWLRVQLKNDLVNIRNLTPPQDYKLSDLVRA